MNEEVYEVKIKEIEERFKKYDEWTKRFVSKYTPTTQAVLAMICQELLQVQKELINIQKLLSKPN